MTHEQFNEWIAKDIIEPIGHAGTHSILAKIGVLISSFLGSKDVTMQSFLYWAENEDKPAEIETAFQSLEAIGGRRT